MTDAPMIDGDSASNAAIPPVDVESTPVEVGYCLRCGYDMRGLGTEVCPECGTRFDAEAARAFVNKWAWNLRWRLRLANVVSAIGCLVAALYLLTGMHVVLLATIVIGIASLAYLSIFLVHYVLMWFLGGEQSESRPMVLQEAFAGIRNCSVAGIVVMLIIGGAYVTIKGGVIGAGVPAALGLGLLVWQIRTYSVGRDRGYLVGIPESYAESIPYAVGISKFFAVISFILLAALLSVR